MCGSAVGLRRKTVKRAPRERVSDLWVPVYIPTTNLPRALCILLAIRLAEGLSSKGVISEQCSWPPLSPAVSNRTLVYWSWWWKHKQLSFLAAKVVSPDGGANIAGPVANTTPTFMCSLIIGPIWSFGKANAAGQVYRGQHSLSSS